MTVAFCSGILYGLWTPLRPPLSSELGAVEVWYA